MDKCPKCGSKHVRHICYSPINVGRKKQLFNKNGWYCEICTAGPFQQLIATPNTQEKEE